MEQAILYTIFSLIAVYCFLVVACYNINLSTARDFLFFYDQNAAWETREELLKMLTDMIVWVSETYDTELRVNITKDEFVRLSLGTLRELTYDALDDIYAQLRTVSLTAAFHLKVFTKVTEE